jgi:hypothetical protein
MEMRNVGAAGWPPVIFDGLTICNPGCINLWKTIFGVGRVVMSRAVRAASRPPLHFCLFVFLLSPCVLRAETPQDLFKAGNALYADGKFSEAVQKYQAADDQGLRHWTLEYNLGNAYYRAGQLGRAIAHYERAFRMNSGQNDVIYNLGLATQKAGDPELPTSALSALAWRLFYFLSINTLTICASIVFLLLCGGVGVLLLSFSGMSFPRKRESIMTVDGMMVPRFRGDDSGVIWASIMVFVIVSLWLGMRIYLLEKSIGVVVSPVAEVRSGPNTSYPANFTVPEGRRVLILEEQEPIQEWLEIGVPQEGLKGWVPQNSVEIL